ncbi:aldolase/citrate lyase family protein [Paraburkholderia bonniea]|uniref:HpcH/HpaI aldolase family protein n=1 Tax=Paraburkholderia bonniea TaxID=2152891 RepID=UPI002573F649|nr:aldolase/citrate lyase family protein [Paraburkholderia bonniea]WJF90045.1 aldolase/citrate lyase family protein [Paraburkholderia bonniea]WJF93359.1 aldolase/citrate lyase family protein [Paraburkholderia bonniea]
MTSIETGSPSCQIGTFVKTPAPQIIEILGGAGLDFAVVDAEHAPFDRLTLDMMIIAARSVGLALFVRIPDKQASTIQSALDCGATGLLVPHVDSAEQARELVARARFIGGERGYSSSPRFASYGANGMKQTIATGDQAVLMCQIESRAALADAAQIAATPGVAGLFVGRADLALSLGLTDARAPEVMEATEQILAIAQRAGKIPGVATGSVNECTEFAQMGATWFVVGSDQSMLRQGALALKK